MTSQLYCPPLLLSVGSFVGPVALGLALSAGAFVGMAAYALLRASKETGESPELLISRARSRMQAIAGRARSRWESGEVRASWSHQRRAGLRLVAGVLAGQAAILLGMATGSRGLLGPGTAVFAVTVMLVCCLLVNVVLSLLWLAGPAPGGERRLFSPASGDKAAPTTVRELLLPRAAPLPPKSN